MSTAVPSRASNNPPSDPPSEPTGPVTKDSLANESIQADGGFAENENPEVLGVKGSQSTLTNEDTTNAEKLDPAPSAPIRDNTQDETTQYPDADAPTEFSGTTSTEGYVGGPSAGYTSTTGTSSTSDSSSSDPPSANLGTAPSYISTATGDANAPSDMKPKGTNLVEDKGIPADHETTVGPIGGQDDPGRLAELKFQTQGADSSGGLGARDYAEVGTASGAYDALDGEREA